MYVNRQNKKVKNMVQYNVVQYSNTFNYDLSNPTTITGEQFVCVFVWFRGTAFAYGVCYWYLLSFHLTSNGK